MMGRSSCWLSSCGFPSRKLCICSPVSDGSPFAWLRKLRTSHNLCSSRAPRRGPSRTLSTCNCTTCGSRPASCRKSSICSQTTCGCSSVSVRNGCICRSPCSSCGLGCGSCRRRHICSLSICAFLCGITATWSSPFRKIVGVQRPVRIVLVGFFHNFEN